MTGHRPGAEATDGIADGVWAAALLAVDPAGLGGVWLRALHGPARDAWLALLCVLLPEKAPIRRVPAQVSDDRLLGGLDLAATLRVGRPVAQHGLLAEVDGGVAVLAMAERLPPATAAKLGAVLDTGEVATERDGMTLKVPARLGVVALDEGMADDEHPPPGLIDRLGFHLDLARASAADFTSGYDFAAVVPSARAKLPDVAIDDAALEALCGGAMALGIASARGTILAVRAARAAAALAGRLTVADEDTALAARLVCAWRATRMPATESLWEDAAEPSPENRTDVSPEDGTHPLAENAAEPSPRNTVPPQGNEADPPPEDASPDRSKPDTDWDRSEGELPGGIVVAAARAALPADILSRLLLGEAPRGLRAAPGRSGQTGASPRHGRPIGARPGDPRGGAHLHLVETLKAAAPWQRLRQNGGGARIRRLLVRRDDFRIIRFRQRIGTTTIFVVDASGSAAAQRLAEAKGAVELLLADCYARRDQVALIAFRGRDATLLLPPTNSLVRAKRCLAGLAGGGGTPLAAGIDAAHALAETVRRSGRTPILTVLTDGRANIARDGRPDRGAAETDAHAAARRVRASGFATLLIDVSRRPDEAALSLAITLGARHLPLPHARAAALTQAVRDLTDQGRLGSAGHTPQGGIPGHHGSEPRDKARGAA